MGRKRKNGGKPNDGNAAKTSVTPRDSSPASTRATGVGTPGRGRGPWIAFLVLCVVGLALSAELERQHVRLHTDPSYESYCAVSQSLNCDTVATSSWSVTLGLPLSVWGLIAYLTMGLLVARALATRLRSGAWQYAVAAVLAWIAAASGVVLLAISHFVIGAICLFCVGTYLVNFALAGTALVGLRGAEKGAVVTTLVGSLRQNRGAVLAFSIASLALVLLVRSQVPEYWRSTFSVGPGGLAAGVDAQGHPWIGATRPDAVIVEYSDYECPHCERGHAQVRALVAEHPDRLRLVHRHYPLDDKCNPTIREPFHANACEYARMAWCAQQQDRFWPANDFLYQNRGRRILPRELAEAVGANVSALEACASSAGAAAVVDDDMASGRGAGITGTPTFVFGGKLYPGGIPPEALAAVLGTSPSTPASTP